MSKVVDRKTKELQRELEAIKIRKEEEALHRLPRRSNTAGTGTSTITSIENSDIGSGASTTHMRNPPTSTTKRRPREHRYKSQLDIHAKHKKNPRKSV